MYRRIVSGHLLGGETSTPLFLIGDAEYDWLSALSALPVRLRAGEIFLFANRKSYFVSVISSYIVKYINSFHNSINKQFHMFMSICL